MTIGGDLSLASNAIGGDGNFGGNATGVAGTVQANGASLAIGGVASSDAGAIGGNAGLLRAANEAGVLEASDVHVAARLGEVTGERVEAVLLAVALAVRADAPIFAAEDVIEESAVEAERPPNEQQVVEDFRRFLDELSPDDFLRDE